MQTQYFSENLKGEGISRRKTEENIKTGLIKQSGILRNRFTWLKIGTNGGLYQRGNESLGSITASPEGLCSMKWVS
jgi:hypothetical protein